MTTIVDQPALVQARDGFVSELERAGFLGDKVVFRVESAQGSVDRADQIAGQFVADGVDLIYAIGTPSASAARNRTTRIPIVFSAVTDPVDARLVESLQVPGGNATGVSDFVGAPEQLSFFDVVLPGKRRVGIVYDPSQPSASATLAALKAAGPAAGYTIETSAVDSSTVVKNAAASLISSVDFLYIVPDNTVGSALEVMSDVSRERRVPLLSCEPGAVTDGAAVAALTVDYEDQGRRAARIALRIHDGESPARIPVETIVEPAIVVSLQNAAAVGVTISDNVRARSTLSDHP